ncbi:MAG: CoA-binding protein, partial [Chloroflexota bacterium]
MTGEIVKQLDIIFKASSIAVIGASNTRRKWGYGLVNNPLKSGYRGAIYPVNPKEKEIIGIRAYPSVGDIPYDVDLAVVAVPARAVPKVMAECVAKGIKGAVLVTAGFAEIGEEGRILQDEVVKIAQQGGMRFVGPNGQGIWSSAVRLNLSFDEHLQEGHIAFVSQSGTFGDFLARLANIKGYGLSKFI